MLGRSVSSALLWVCTLSAEVPTSVDFKRDVQPILREHCIGCHGPTQQMARFRLDRRRDAMRGGTIAVIAPGTSSGSRLYHKLTGTKYGTRMPPTGPLSAEHIEIMKRWLDQGAPWPDELSGEVAGAPPDKDAARMMEALRSGDGKTFQKMLRADASAANRKGPGGATPLMYASLYSDAASVRLLLKSGADPNIRNEAGASALMWAIADVEKARLLLDAGADVDAKSGDGQTALSIAAGRHGSAAALKLLLDRGARLSASERAPVNEAASAGDEATLRVLIASGQVKGALPLAAAIRGRCGACVDILLESAKPDDLKRAVLGSAGRSDPALFKRLLDLGASVDAKDAEGRSVLMLAASSEAAPEEIVKALLDRGLDVNAKSANGETALDFALRHGDTPVARLLKKADARAGSSPALPGRKPKPADSARAAVERSLPLLQRVDDVFLRKSGCVSCHHNNLTAMTVAAARKSGARVDEEAARRHLKTIGPYLESWRERALQGIGIPGGPDTVSYILIGLAAANYPPDAATDALAYYLKGRQRSDGRWVIQSHRPPMESSDIQVTAASLRAIQIYAPRPHRAQYERAIQLAAGWLAAAQPATTEDRAFQLLGFEWAGASRQLAAKAGRALLAEQRADRGWAQLPSLSSDAYATGQAMVALRESGVLAATAPAYQRGIRYLLTSQFEDGSWYVSSRAIPFQPFFETGFPFGHDQWISAAATNWAAMALAFGSR